MIEIKPNFEPVIELCKKPMEELTSLKETLTKSLNFYTKTHFMVKPFLKRDIKSFTNLEEEELLDFLNRLITSLDKIKNAALDKATQRPIDDSVFEDLKPKYIIEEQAAKEEIEEKLETDKKNLLLSAEKEDIQLALGENKPQENMVYCPECGHQCQDEKELKTHISMVHKSTRARPRKRRITHNKRWKMPRATVPARSRDILKIRAR